LINFVIVLLILGSSAVAIFSVMQNVLNTQRAQNIQNSSRNFLYVFSNELQKSDFEFAGILESGLSTFMMRRSLSGTANDFVIELNGDDNNRINRIITSGSVSLPGS